MPVSCFAKMNDAFLIHDGGHTVRSAFGQQHLVAAAGRHEGDGGYQKKETEGVDGGESQGVKKGRRAASLPYICPLALTEKHGQIRPTTRDVTRQGASPPRFY